MNSFQKLLSTIGVSEDRVSLAHWVRSIRRGVRQRQRLIELVFFAWLLPAGGLLIFPANPTGLMSGFPWLIAGPLLFAARYGGGWGVSCGLLMSLFLAFPFASYAELASQHSVLSIGTVVMSLVVGDAATAWRKSSQKSEAENQYLRHRLKEFSTDYHVLKVSHGLLEEYMAGQRLSLREALQQLKPVLTSSEHGIKAGYELMAVFSQFCSIQVAGLYAMSDNNLVNKQPIATHGDMFELPLFDPLLRAAISKHEVASVKLESLAENHHERSLLAVVPLVDTEGHLHGVLAIKDMHFMAFQQQNLNLLALLGYYVGNQLTRSRGAALSRAHWFIAELDTVLRFAHSHNTESTLLCLKFSGDTDNAHIAQFISSAIRSLDASWMLIGDSGAPVLSLLLPLMSETQSCVFMQRVSDAVKEQFGVELQDVLDGSVMHQIDDTESRVSCLHFLGEHIGAHAIRAALLDDSIEQEQSGAA